MSKGQINQRITLEYFPSSHRIGNVKLTILKKISMDNICTMEMFVYVPRIVRRLYGLNNIHCNLWQYYSDEKHYWVNFTSIDIAILTS